MGFRYAHVLGPPASEAAIEKWPHVLPDDLLDFVLRVNGVHLRANLETGRAYMGLDAIENWDHAYKRFGLATASESGILGPQCFAISYHADGAAFVVIDAQTGVYYLVDTAGPDSTSPIGTSLEELLDWLWRTRVFPK